MKKMIVVIGALLFASGCVGVSYQSRDGRTVANGTALSADSAATVMTTGAFVDAAGLAAGERPVFGSHCVGSYGAQNCATVSNIPVVGAFAGFGYGAVDPLYAGQVAGALQYLDYSARAVGSPTVIDPLQLQLLQHRVGAVEGRVEKAEAKGAAVLEAIGEAAK